jgi:hypothetical protein
MLPPELTVTIEKIGQDQYLAKTIRGDNQADVCANTFTYRPDDLIDLEPQWMLERAIPRGSVEPVLRQDGEGEAAPAPGETEKLAGYGRRLYGFLFGDGRELDAFLRFNDAYRRQARLTLKLHGNAAGLWRLPWEYLHDGRDFLALHGRFLLSRTPYGLAELRPEPVELPLRILVVIAAPDDQATLDTEEEIRFIQEALDEAVRANRVLVEYLDDATLPAIGQALRRLRPHLLHYTGHGIYKQEQGRSYLALETEAGRTKLAGIEELRPYLAEAAELRLVFLSGCQTAQTSPDDAFSGVATGLLEGHVPAGAGHAVLGTGQLGHRAGQSLLRRPGPGRHPGSGHAAGPAGPARLGQRPRLRLGHPRPLPAGPGVAPGRPGRGPARAACPPGPVGRHGRPAPAAPFCGSQKRAAPVAPRLAGADGDCRLYPGHRRHW